MTGEFYKRLMKGHSSPGLVIVRQDLNTGRAIEDLLLIWDAPDEEMRDQVRWVPMGG